MPSSCRNGSLGVVITQPAELAVVGRKDGVDHDHLLFGELRYLSLDAWAAATGSLLVHTESRSTTQDALHDAFRVQDEADVYSHQFSW